MKPLSYYVTEAIKESGNHGAYDPSVLGIDDIGAMDCQAYLEAYTTVKDNKSKRPVDWRLDGVNEHLTARIMDYGDDPGYTIDGVPKFLVVVGSRQSTKSTTAAAVMYKRAATNPGSESFILADTNKRAKYLYDRALHIHASLPEQVRCPTKSTGLEHSLKFDPKYGGSLDFFSAERKGGMVGFSGQNGQISEIPFMLNPGKTLSVLLPAMYHQTDSRLILESTPAPPTYNGADHWKQMVMAAMKPDNRFELVFSPFWESNINSEHWRKEWKPDQAELKLMNDFGPMGLTWGNLAFRKNVMNTDTELKLNPELFEVWFPFSLATCWGSGAFGVYSDKVLTRHKLAWKDSQHAPFAIDPWRRYIFGVDPAGLMGGADHAACAVLGADQTDVKLYEVLSDDYTVFEFVDELLKMAERYRAVTGAWPDIAVESNGVGNATLALLQERQYDGIYYEKRRTPGITAGKNANKRIIMSTAEMLLERMEPIWSLPLYMQLASYSADRSKRTTELSHLINGLAKGRRTRQHWDLCSAFMLACDATSNLPLPRQPVTEVPVFMEVREVTPLSIEKQRRAQRKDDIRRKRRQRRRT